MSPSPNRRSTTTPGPRLPPESLAAAMLHAAVLLARVRSGHALSAELPALWKREPALSPQQRGAIQDLAYASLRDYALGDRLLAPLLRSPPADPIYSLLLIARRRLDSRPEQAHTIVDQAVSAATLASAGRLGGLANAVLRNYLRNRDQLHQALAQDPEASSRHPHWWIEQLRTAYPVDWEEILNRGNDHPPMALRVNLRRSTRADYLSRLEAAGIAATPVGATGVLLADPLPLSRIPGFSDGSCSIQDPAAQHAALLLDLRPGQRVLDACAAPGGKSGHILETCDVELTALDRSPERLAKVRENLDRLGQRALLTVADCTQLDTWWDGRHFDRILADVPCSASGVVRRHPDIKWLRRPEDIPGFARQQAQIMDRLWQTLAPGGKMLYATCSLFPEENQHQAEGFRSTHPDARALPLGEAPYRQLLPCAHHDGFFYAMFEKTL